MERHHRDGPDHARQDPERDLGNQRALDVEEMVEPAVRVVLDHAPWMTSRSFTVGSEPDPSSELTGLVNDWQGPRADSRTSIRLD